MHQQLVKSNFASVGMIHKLSSKPVVEGRRQQVFTNGLIGMAVAALGLFWMLVTCASETKENFDRALAKELEDADA
jgi:hypothetical protein